MKKDEITRCREKGWDGTYNEYLEWAVGNPDDELDDDENDKIY